MHACARQLKTIAEKFTKAAEDKAAEAEKWKAATAPAEAGAEEEKPAEEGAAAEGAESAEGETPAEGEAAAEGEVFTSILSTYTRMRQALKITKTFSAQIAR
jgi:hypothetical protein